MTKLAIGAAFSLMVATTSLAHADSDVPDDSQSIIDDTAADVPQPVLAVRTVQVRLTYYTEYGVTASGSHPYPGSTACSYNFAFGTRFRLADGELFTCNDRGMLGSSGWLDLWRRPDLAARYGPYATAEVLP